MNPTTRTKSANISVLMSLALRVKKGVCPVWMTSVGEKLTGGFLDCCYRCPRVETSWYILNLQIKGACDLSRLFLSVPLGQLLSVDMTMMSKFLFLNHSSRKALRYCSFARATVANLIQFQRKSEIFKVMERS